MVHIEMAFLQCRKAYGASRRFFFKYLSQCLHWKGIYTANVFMCNFKLFPLNTFKHIVDSSHTEGLSPVCSDHVDLQTPPT